jgi:hypothetical protein
VTYEKCGHGYTTEHEVRVAAGKDKRAVKGELHGLRGDQVEAGCEEMKAPTGIEPVWTALQAAA